MYMPKKEHTSKTFLNMLNVIEEKEIPLYTAKRGVTLIDQTDLKAELLSPVSETYEDLNNYSAVLKVTYGKTGLLFTGDAEQEVEKPKRIAIACDIIKSFCLAGLNITMNQYNNK
jgi:competence protein ComEC